MGDPISSIVDPINSNLVNLASSLIRGEYNLVEGVEQEVEKLSSHFTAIQASLKTAEEKQLEENHWRDWLEKLKNVGWDAEDVLDTFKTNASLWKRKQEVRCFRPPFSLSKTSYKYDAAHRIKEISLKLQSIAEERRFHPNSDVDARNDIHIPTSSSVETGCVFGREDDKKRLIALLLSDESEKQMKVSLIPIIGMGGLGKTTLARLVYNDSSVEKNFEYRMWVCVSAQFNLTLILREMMNTYLKSPLSGDLSSSLVEFQFREFLSGKRFLLVLDDVWSVDYNKDWNPLLRLLGMGKKGSKVIVTTQNQKVAEIVDAESLHMLERLPENECWSLFKNSAFRSGNLSSSMQKDLEQIGKEIVHKCDGLPLAVKAIGNHLQRNVQVSTWRKAMNSSLKEIDDSNSLNILSTLKLSYVYLPSHLKQCFAFCSIFPKAYAFDKAEMVKLWMSQSFIQPRGVDRVEKIGIEYFDELLARSFFQVSNIHSKVQYTMHDLIHDLAQSVSSTYCCQVKDIKSCSFSKDYRHMSLLCQDVEKSSLNIVDRSIKLRTLLLPGDSVKDFGEALEKMLHTLKYMRALDLSSSTLQQLPNSIKELKLLRYLDLSKTDIKVLPDSVCNLYNLQTLKMLGCPWLFALPKDLCELVNLHYLELDDLFWFKCEALPPSIGKLTNLHNLTAFRVGHKTGYGIEELKDMAYLTGTLHISMLENAGNAKDAKLNEKESLQKLVFEWSNRDVNQHDEAAGERILEDLQPHSNIKELQICNYIGLGFPTWMRDGRLQNLVNVTLNDCTKTKTLVLGQLPNLEALNIKGLQELEEWPNVQCISLHILKVYDCPKLIKLPDIFHKLGILKIKRCNSLKVLPVTPCLESLMVVDNSSLERWNELTMPFECQVEISALSKLEELNIGNCPKLSAWPQDLSVKKLEISRCDLLTIPSTKHMQHLQHLSLDTCTDGTLLGLVPYLSSLYSLILSNIANLVYFPKLPHLPELKALYIHSCKKLVSLSQDEETLQSLTSLKVLSIKDCPNLKTLPKGLPASLEYLSFNSCAGLDSLGPKGMLKSLTSLRDLYIQNCPRIHSFPEDGLPASLQHLHVQDCPLLTEGCQKENGGGPEWPKIVNIPDLEIDSTKLSIPDSPSWNCNFFCGRG